MKKKINKEKVAEIAGYVGKGAVALIPGSELVYGIFNPDAAEGAVIFELLKLALEAGIVFGAVMAPIHSASNSKINDMRESLQRNLRESEIVLVQNIEQLNPEFENTSIKSITFDRETGRLGGLMTYDKKNEDGYTVNYSGIYKSNCDPQFVNHFLKNAEQFDVLFQHYTSDVVDFTTDNMKVEYMSTAGAQKREIENFKEKIELLNNNLNDVFTTISDFETTEIGTTYNLKKSLHNVNVLNITPVQINNSGTKGCFYVDFINTNAKYDKDKTLSNASESYKQFHSNPFMHYQVTVDCSDLETKDETTVTKYCYDQLLKDKHEELNPVEKNTEASDQQLYLFNK